MRKPTLLPVATALLGLASLSPSQDAPASEAPAVPTVKLVRPSGVYADLAESGFNLTSALLGGATGKVHPFYALLDQIERLGSGDDEVVLFDLSRPFGLNLPQLAEITRAIAKLRAAGKKCYAYLENAGPAQYQIAAQCDRIAMADMGNIDLRSLAISTTFLRDALDLLGVHMDVIRCGSFKGAVEPYVLSQMSDHLRRHYLRMLQSMNEGVVQRIAKGRGLEPSKVRELQGQRLFTGKEALVAGLVDRLVPWEGSKRAVETLLTVPEVKLDDALRPERRRRGFNPMAMLTELFQPKKEVEVEEAQTVVVLHLSGTIVDGTKPAPGNIVSGPTVSTVRGLTENDKVKAVVLRINSPGGSATASEAILLALTELAKRKPVVCSMGYVAASGGYYVTCFGRPILAEIGTITGSIGVFGMKPNLGPLMRRIGLRQELIALDDSASLDAIDRGWTDADKAMLQHHIDEVYDRFVGHVAASRKMAREAVLSIAGGRVWSGKQAVENGLVDRLGGLEDAIAMVAKEAELGNDYEVVHMPKPRSFMDAFAESLMDVSLREKLPAGLARVALGRLGGLRSALAVLRDACENAAPARVWALMPAELDLLGAGSR